MSYEMIATLMFSSMMLMLLTGQRVFGAIGFIAVVSALLLYGVDAGRLDARGLGPDQPIRDNGTEEGRQQNRRVELVRVP